MLMNYELSEMMNMNILFRICIMSHFIRIEELFNWNLIMMPLSFHGRRLRYWNCFSRLFCRGLFYTMYSIDHGRSARRSSSSTEVWLMSYLCKASTSFYDLTHHEYHEIRFTFLHVMTSWNYLVVDWKKTSNSLQKEWENITQSAKSSLFPLRNTHSFWLSPNSESALYLPPEKVFDMWIKTYYHYDYYYINHIW